MRFWWEFGTNDTLSWLCSAAHRWNQKTGEHFKWHRISLILINVIHLGPIWHLFYWTHSCCLCTAECQNAATECLRIIEVVYLCPTENNTTDWIQNRTCDPVSACTVHALSNFCRVWMWSCFSSQRVWFRVCDFIRPCKWDHFSQKICSCAYSELSCAGTQLFISGQHIKMIKISRFQSMEIIEKCRYNRVLHFN